MKKLFAVIPLIALMFTTLPASAGHLPAPELEQVRQEAIWFCKTNDDQMVNLRLFYATKFFQDAGLPSTAWMASMEQLVSSGQCSVINNVEYVVKEIVSTTVAPIIDDTGEYGEVATFYLLRVVDASDPTGPTFLVVTY